MYFHVVFHWLIKLETTIRLSFTVCLKPSFNPENDLERDREVSLEPQNYQFHSLRSQLTCSLTNTIFFLWWTHVFQNDSLKIQFIGFAKPSQYCRDLFSTHAAWPSKFWLWSGTNFPFWMQYNITVTSQRSRDSRK